MRARPSLAYLFFWTLAALYFAGESYLAGVVLGRAIGWPQAIAYSFAGWSVWAALAPAIVRLGRAVPFRTGRIAYAVVFHVGASALFGLVHAAGEVALQHVLAVSAWPGFAEALRLRLRIGSHLDLITYWAILGASYAVAYYRRENERELRASRLAGSLAEARLELLRAQLDPHFLFNALNALSGLVHSDPDAADRMIAHVGELLRASLDGRGRQEVALREELRLLELYAGIERTRFRGRLSIVVDADRELLDVLVPSLVLQPLVENAIRHGIAPRAGPGEVRVSVCLAGDALELAVSDDGVGLSGDPLAAGPGRVPGENGYRRAGAIGSGRDGGIGLENTRARLEQLYGDAQRLEISERAGGGLAVRLLIPLRQSASATAAASAGALSATRRGDA